MLHTKLLLPTFWSHFRTTRCFSGSRPKEASAPKALEKSSDNVLTGGSGNVVEDLYNQWHQDHKSVHPRWDRYFKEHERQSSLVPTDTEVDKSELSGTKKADDIQNFEEEVQQQPQKLEAKGDDNELYERPPPECPPVAKYTEEDIIQHQALQALIRSYQNRGHLCAEIDPLDIVNKPVTEINGLKRRADKRVTRSHFKYNVAQYDNEYILPATTYIGGNKKVMKFRDIIENLERVYCNKIGIEYTHVAGYEQSEWVKKKFETPGIMEFSTHEKRRLLFRLTRATAFEAFLSKKWPSEKRFGIEGSEMTIPGIQKIIDISLNNGVQSVVVGMAHRGRLNVLANIAKKSLKEIFYQFSPSAEMLTGSGDVKYHLGLLIERMNSESNRMFRFSLVANPSHLEAVNPLVLGRTRAEQFYNGDCDGKRTMPILIHGDASFCGQGVVYESIHLADLPAYTTYGTIHVVINNQVGFTTDPRFSRSSPYCTDVARVLQAPIFHVNSDAPEAVMHVCKVAAEWRAKFHKDVVIDIVGYRRNGHNEADEPMFTQPLMYQKIRNMKNCLTLYTEQLIAEGAVTAEEAKKYLTDYEQECEKSFQESLVSTFATTDEWQDSPWRAFFQGRDTSCIEPTGVQEEVLQTISKAFASPPPDPKFVIHTGLQRVLKTRTELVEKRLADWAMGEALAFGALLKDGYHVRLNGQDVERGTFSQRHHVFHHQKIDKATYCSLHHLYPDQAKYAVDNSSLSEFGVSGFCLGYSFANPNALVIWEGQFGDFANGATVIFDQFVASGEQKWQRQTGSVYMLPHGMEGQGPEHSSGRIERFLQSSDDDEDKMPDLKDNFVVNQLKSINWIVANCSTPANLFHILRRQMKMPFRKPLILFTPKSLLRLPECRSSFDDMLYGTEFQRVIPNVGSACGDSIKKVIFCSGRVYYDLAKARKERGKEDCIAILRVEQISPFPYDLVIKEADKYKDAQLIWVQEEHKNQGSYSYVKPRFKTAFKGSRDICYVGRPPAASTATGYKKTHTAELEAILTALFGPPPPKKDPPKEEPPKAADCAPPPKDEPCVEPPKKDEKCAEPPKKDEKCAEPQKRDDKCAEPPKKDDKCAEPPKKEVCTASSKDNESNKLLSNEIVPVTKGKKEVLSSPLDACPQNKIVPMPVIDPNSNIEDGDESDDPADMFDQSFSDNEED